MKYLLEPRGDDFFGILNNDSDCYVGYVALRRSRYHVQNVEGDEIAVARSLDDAIPALAAYYEKNPPRWERESARRYNELTQFGLLRVEQDQPGQWLAYRNDYPLMRDGKSAIFATCEEAQRAADTHMRDDYPNSETVCDGLAWLPDLYPWWSSPNRVAVRTRWAASHA
jgi:hypothetical protein